MTVLAAQLDRNTRTIERMTLAATGMTVGLYLWRRSLELNYPNWP